MKRKSDLVHYLAKNAMLSDERARHVVEVMESFFEKAIRSGEGLAWSGIGVFEVRQRAARQGRHPRTGEPMTLPAYKTVGFRAYKRLSDAAKD